MTAKNHMALLVAALLLATGSFAQTFSYLSIDVPCSAAAPLHCPNGIAARTALSGINPAGDIVGNFTDGVGRQHGFVLSNGRFFTIDVPGSLVGVTDTLPTIARGIGPSGDIVGQFSAPYNPPLSTTAPVDSPSYCPGAGSVACIKGFLYSRARFSAVMFPGHPGAIPGAINPDGSIYGCLHNYDSMASMFSAAWLRSGDTVLTVSIATGGGELSDPAQSFPCSMHGGAAPDGTVVGFYGEMTNACKTNHGYILQNGILQTYDVPGSLSTTLWDINPGKAIVGTYIDGSAHQHGLLQLPGSLPITIDAPSTAPFHAVKTVLQGINPGGAMTGQYTDISGHTHGLVIVPSTE